MIEFFVHFKFIAIRLMIDRSLALQHRGHFNKVHSHVMRNVEVRAVLWVGLIPVFEVEVLYGLLN